MKNCPVCHSKTIPLSWVFFGRSSHKEGQCIRCTNCGNRIRQKYNWLTELFAWSFEGNILFIVIVSWIVTRLPVNLSFFEILIVFLLFIFGLNYFKPLAIADDGYCRGDMSKIGAFFGLIFMGFLIVMLVYCFIVQPFILGEPVCKRFF